jgi:hypothetical protein
MTALADWIVVISSGDDLAPRPLSHTYANATHAAEPRTAAHPRAADRPDTNASDPKMIAAPAMPSPRAVSLRTVGRSSASAQPNTSARSGVPDWMIAVRPDGMNCAPQNSSA